MDIYTFLQEVIPPDQKHLSATDFESEKTCELSEKDQQVCSLLKNIASVGVFYDRDAVRFVPQFEFADGRRTFSVEDLSDSDYLILQSLEIEKLPNLLKARIADILWTEKHDYNMARVSMDTCHELYYHFFDCINWVESFKFIEHAVGLAAKINAKQKRAEYLQEVYDKIVEMNGEDTSFLSIKLVELLISQNWESINLLPASIDIIIAKSQENIDKVERAFFTKAKALNKMGKPEDASANNLDLARFLESKASLMDKDNPQSVFLAERYFQKAVHIYRNNGAQEEGRKAHEKLTNIQKRIPQLMFPISSTIDTSQEYQKLHDLFQGLSFQESIVKLAQCTSLFKKSELKQRVLEDAIDPISCLFGCGIKSSSGQTIVEIPPLDISAPESNTETLELHMHRTALMRANIHGSTVSKWALELIRFSFSFSADDLQFLIKENPIIPAGREQIFQTGLFLGLNGELYPALHILAPQVENLFRNIAQEAGAVMSTLNADNTSDSKLLSSIFDTPELLDCYDNDILFMFKGLMNEKVGANIRNEIAHGIMSEQKGNSGVARFFFCLVIKLLSFTSKNCYQIALESNLSEKSQHNEQ